MKVICHTNLDLMPAEDWPDELPAVPRVGDEIESKMFWSFADTGTFRLSLKVVAVRWCFNGVDWTPHIELHTNQSIREFFEWYAPKVGRRVSSFI